MKGEKVKVNISKCFYTNKPNKRELISNIQQKITYFPAKYKWMLNKLFFLNIRDFLFLNFECVNYLSELTSTKMQVSAFLGLLRMGCIIVFFQKLLIEMKIKWLMIPILITDPGPVFIFQEQSYIGKIYEILLF